MLAKMGCRGSFVAVVVRVKFLRVGREKDGEEREEVRLKRRILCLPDPATLTSPGPPCLGVHREVCERAVKYDRPQM